MFAFQVLTFFQHKQCLVWKLIYGVNWFWNGFNLTLSLGHQEGHVNSINVANSRINDHASKKQKGSLQRGKKKKKTPLKLMWGNFKFLLHKETVFTVKKISTSAFWEFWVFLPWSTTIPAENHISESNTCLQVTGGWEPQDCPIRSIRLSSTNKPFYTNRCFSPPLWRVQHLCKWTQSREFSLTRPKACMAFCKN